MSWTVEVLKNTLLVDVAALEELQSDDGDDVIDQEPEEGAEEGRTSLYFNPDHMEHIDWLWHDGVAEILIQHNAVGEVLFGQVEGDGGPRFWGYRFGPSGMTKLRGEISWSVR